MEPVTKSWQELGFEGIDEPTDDMPRGEEAFRQLTPEQQRQILGPTKYDLFEIGKISLADLVVQTNNGAWGTMRREASVKEALANAEARQKQTRPTRKANEPPPKPGSFKTAAQAEAWAKGAYPHIAFDFAGMVPETLNPTLREFERLATKYPEVVNRLRYVGGYQGTAGKAWVQHTGGFRSPNVFAHATPDGGKVMGLNPRFYGNPALFEASLAKGQRLDPLTGRSWAPHGADKIESVFVHEFGHLVDGWAHIELGDKSFTRFVPMGGGNRVVEALAAWDQKFNAGRPFISDYAKRNIRERFAEAFSAYELGLTYPNGRAYEDVRAMERLIDVLTGTPFYNELDTQFIWDLPYEEQAAARTEVQKTLDAIDRRLGFKKRGAS